MSEGQAIESKEITSDHGLVAHLNAFLTHIKAKDWSTNVRRPLRWIRALQLVLLVVTIGVLIGSFSNLPVHHLPVSTMILSNPTFTLGAGAALSFPMQPHILINLNSILAFVAISLTLSGLTTLTLLFTRRFAATRAELAAEISSTLFLLVSWILQVSVWSDQSCSLRHTLFSPISDPRALQADLLCNVSKALAAFLVLTWLSFLGSNVFAIMEYRQTQTCSSSLGEGERQIEMFGPQTVTAKPEMQNCEEHGNTSIRGTAGDEV